MNMARLAEIYNVQVVASPEIETDKPIHVSLRLPNGTHIQMHTEGSTVMIKDSRYPIAEAGMVSAHGLLLWLAMALCDQTRPPKEVANGA